MKKQTYKIVPGEGDNCHRCGRPTQIREHDVLTDKHLSQPFYYSRWFNCTNVDCKTTLIMPDQYRVFNEKVAEVSSVEQKPEDEETIKQVLQSISSALWSIEGVLEGLADRVDAFTDLLRSTTYSVGRESYPGAEDQPRSIRTNVD